MKPNELKRAVEKLQALGFKVEVGMGPVDRASRPTSIELVVKPRKLAIAERDAFKA